MSLIGKTYNVIAASVISGAILTLGIQQVRAFRDERDLTNNLTSELKLIYERDAQLKGQTAELIGQNRVYQEGIEGIMKDLRKH
ncbi:hypothetical protein J4217_04610 [Candidatus Pacearchaeota archaeon]|nr:hypothetical protein [Candidatus Pacearchaeota archaeon]